MIEIARWIILAALVYLAVGSAFALPFAFVGAHKIDPAARGTNWAFRLLIIPGSAAFWPLLAYRWSVAEELAPPDTTDTTDTTDQPAAPDNTPKL